MGGEPTFVSIDDYQAAEWNTAALGPTKRILSDQLVRRLRDRFAPGGSCTTARANGIRRAAAALGVRALLAQGRQAALAQRQLIAAETGGRTPPRADEPGSGRSVISAFTRVFRCAMRAHVRRVAALAARFARQRGIGR